MAERHERFIAEGEYVVRRLFASRFRAESVLVTQNKAEEIAAIAPQTVMLMFTMYASDHFLKEAQKAGIRDVISKSEGEEPLLKSLKSILSLVA